MTFADGTVLTPAPVSVVGCRLYDRDVLREALEFRFAAEGASMDALDAAFSPERCAVLTLTPEDGAGSAYAHEGYVVRMSLEKRFAAGESGGWCEMLVVRMGRRSEAEEALAALMGESAGLSEIPVSEESGG